MTMRNSDPFGDLYANDHFDRIQRHNEEHDERLALQAEINAENAARMRHMEEHLFILDRNRNYEEQYPELQAAYNEYNRILEKYKIFSALKGKIDDPADK